MHGERHARVVEDELVVMHVEGGRAELHLLGHLAPEAKRDLRARPGPRNARNSVPGAAPASRRASAACDPKNTFGSSTD